MRDLPAAGRPVTLVWVKRVWRCHEPRCAKGTWTETHEQIRARCVLTERARREACRRVGQDGHTVASVAAVFGVGWGHNHGCGPRLRHPAGRRHYRLKDVDTVGVDKTAFLAATALSGARFATGIVALNGPGSAAGRGGGTQRNRVARLGFRPSTGPAGTASRWPRWIVPRVCRAPQGANQPGWVEGPTSGLPQQAGEPDGSLTLEGGKQP